MIMEAVSFFAKSSSLKRSHWQLAEAKQQHVQKTLRSWWRRSPFFPGRQSGFSSLFSSPLTSILWNFSLKRLTNLSSSDRCVVYMRMLLLLLLDRFLQVLSFLLTPGSHSLHPLITLSSGRQEEGTTTTKGGTWAHEDQGTHSLIHETWEADRKEREWCWVNVSVRHFAIYLFAVSSDPNECSVLFLCS